MCKAPQTTTGFTYRLLVTGPAIATFDPMDTIAKVDLPCQESACGRFTVSVTYRTNVPKPPPRATARASGGLMPFRFIDSYVAKPEDKDQGKDTDRATAPVASMPMSIPIPIPIPRRAPTVGLDTATASSVGIAPDPGTMPMPMPMPASPRLAPRDAATGRQFCVLTQLFWGDDTLLASLGVTSYSPITGGFVRLFFHAESAAARARDNLGSKGRMVGPVTCGRDAGVGGVLTGATGAASYSPPMPLVANPYANPFSPTMSFMVTPSGPETPPLLAEFPGPALVSAGGGQPIDDPSGTRRTQFLGIGSGGGGTAALAPSTQPTMTVFTRVKVMSCSTRCAEQGVLGIARHWACLSVGCGFVCRDRKQSPSPWSPWSRHQAALLRLLMRVGRRARLTTASPTVHRRSSCGRWRTWQGMPQHRGNNTEAASHSFSCVETCLGPTLKPAAQPACRP